MTSTVTDGIAAALRARRERLPRTVEGMRAEFEKYMAFFGTCPTVRREPVEVAGVGGEWFLPPDAVPGRAVLYLHGGGYVVGSTATHQCLIGEIAKASHAATLGLNYRLAPEHPHPAALEDALAAYRWLLDGRVDPRGLFVMGDSAGGGLALALLLAAKDAGLPLPAAAVALSPWTDLAATGASLDTRADRDAMLDKRGVLSFSRMVVKDGDPKSPLASPLYGDLRGLPPLLLHVGTEEILHDDATRFAERAQAAGGEVTLEVWDGMLHVWHLFSPILHEAREAIARIGQFAEAHARAGRSA